MAYKFQLGQANLSGSIVATDDDSFDLGSSAKQYKDLYLDGTANIDSLVADTADINGGTIDGAIIGGTSVAAGSFAALVGTTATFSGVLDANSTSDFQGAMNLQAGITVAGAIDANSTSNFQGAMVLQSTILVAGDATLNGALAANGDVDLGNATSDTITATGRFDSDLVPSTDSARDLGTSALQWAGIHADSANIDAVTIATLASAGGTLIDSSGNFAGNNANFVEITGSGDLFLDGSTLRIPSVAAVAFDAADSILLYDATDDKMKKISFPNYASAIAGSGISGSAAGLLSVDIDELSALGSAALHQTQDHFMFSDNGTEKKVTFSNLEDSIFANVSGDATIAAGGALTIAAGAVENSMLADDAVDSDELAAGAVDLAHMSANSIDSDQYVDGSIDLVHMSANSVDSDQYVDGSVDNIHLANSAVTLTQGAGMAAMGSVSLGSSVTVAVDGVLEDLDTLGAASADGEFIVATGAGAFAYESGNTARTSLGLGTGDSPQFTGLTLSGDLTVNGTTTSINSTTINVSSSFTFEGPVDAHETILSCGTPTADITVMLPQYGTEETVHMAVLADASTAASANVTAVEFALLDGGSTVSRITVADADGFLFNDGGTMKQVDVRDVAKYVGDNLAESIDSISSDETLSDFSGGKILLVNSSGGNVTVTLPTSANHSGEIVKVKKISVANNVILEGNGSETLDGQLNITLESPRAALSLISDGSNWFVM